LAYELLNNAVVTPTRLHALVKLVSHFHALKKQDVLSFLQPTVLEENQPIAEYTYTAARQCNLIDENADKTVVLKGDAMQLESINGFREHMQRVILGVTSPGQTNYLFNLYTAWYAVQNERVFQFRLDNQDYETRFVQDMAQNTEARTFNTTKFNGWRPWATFLGSGWLIRPRLSTSSRRGEMLVPDATVRLKGALSQLSLDEQLIPFGVFAERLARICPELDGGVLFKDCWEESRRSEQQGNKLSLMLSTGLRQMHKENAMRLILQSDATDTWQLYPAAGQEVQYITHIRLGGE
jgi:hypothetical protein